MLRKTTLYVARDAREKLQDSAPCVDCCRIIRSLGIKRVVYSVWGGGARSASPEELFGRSCAGRRFLSRESISVCESCA